MKRVIVCLLACMLLISGMLVYVSAEDFVGIDPSVPVVDWDFQYDDSKAYLPIIQVGIVTTTTPFADGPLGPLEDPFTDYTDGPFIDLQDALDTRKLLQCKIAQKPYSPDDLPPELQQDDTYICGAIYQITYDWPITRHELISFAHLIVTEPEVWYWLFSIDPDEENVDEVSVYVSLVEKEVETQNWDDYEEYRTDSKLYFREDALKVDVDLKYASIYRTWDKEDFPELEDLKDVETHVRDKDPANPSVTLTLTFNTPGRATLEDAMEKLCRRLEIASIGFDYGIAVYDVPEPPYDDTTDETTIPDETTVPAGDIETTEPAITNETIGGTETTGESNGEKPTSPQTSDAGRYAACICAAALIGVAGVLLYRKRRAA